jgi:hypothetical protein
MEYFVGSFKTNTVPVLGSTVSLKTLWRPNSRERNVDRKRDSPQDTMKGDKRNGSLKLPNLREQ